MRLNVTWDLEKGFMKQEPDLRPRNVFTIYYEAPPPPVAPYQD